MLIREQLLALILLASLVVLSALLVVHNSFQNRQLFIELNDIEKRFTEMRVEFGRLQLEHGTWASPAMVEQLAVSELGMGVPAREQIVVIDTPIKRNDELRLSRLYARHGESQ